ncbi:hypothetical protein L596_015163 [Steinernema carpocapsae]|uniref:Uncharacterized protein n=1 Tax=Steinernema carpocapsae TaxID=34508 RepID=A0A4U5NF16_STECR|nr:hypothetical protein L596_015163 [Steinernema carpocapsae]
MAERSEEKPVWIYAIFRKNHCGSHEKMNVNLSFDGPVFWDRQVAYIYLCSCHFEQHEQPLLALFKKFEHRVQRICLVDKPVDYPFLPDSLFSYMATSMPKLQFIYLRELDLEKINRATVVELANHKSLKKVIVHGCRNYEVLEDFRSLPQLLVVKGEIVGLKAMLGDLIDYDDSFATDKNTSSSGTQSTSVSSSSKVSTASAELAALEISGQREPSPIATVHCADGQ